MKKSQTVEGMSTSTNISAQLEGEGGASRIQNISTQMERGKGRGGFKTTRHGWKGGRGVEDSKHLDTNGKGRGGFKTTRHRGEGGMGVEDSKHLDTDGKGERASRIQNLST